MLKPTELREQSNLHVQEANEEGDPNLRLSLTRVALALAQLAEEIEREDAHIQIIAEAIAKYREHGKQLPGFEAESAARKIVERLVSAGYKIVSDAATERR